MTWFRRDPPQGKIERDAAVDELRTAVRQAVVEIGKSITNLQAAQAKAARFEQEVRADGPANGS